MGLIVVKSRFMSRGLIKYVANVRMAQPLQDFGKAIWETFIHGCLGLICCATLGFELTH